MVSSPDDSSDDLIDIMSRECSPKEVVMAVEELVESLDRAMQADEESEEQDRRKAGQLSAARQLARLTKAYSAGRILFAVLM